jgi:ectoine hydroxylase
MGSAMMDMTAMSTAQPALQSPRADDRYPSRFESEADVGLRLDPVVYPHTGAGPLSAEALRFYEENGYLHFDELLDVGEVQACLDELGRLRADDSIKDRNEAVIEPGSRELRSIFAVHRSSAVLARIANHPRQSPSSCSAARCTSTSRASTTRAAFAARRSTGIPTSRPGMRRTASPPCAW